MSKLLKTLSDMLEPFVRVVSVDVFIYGVLSLIAFAFILAIILDSSSSIAVSARQIKKLSKEVKYFRIEGENEQLASSVIKVKGLKKPFLKFMSSPSQLPSRVLSFDMITMTKGDAHKNLVFFLICGLAVAATFFFGGVYLSADKMSVFDIFTIIAAQAVLVLIFSLILRLASNSRLKKLHDNYYTFIEGLDSVTQGMVDEFLNKHIVENPGIVEDSTLKDDYFAGYQNDFDMQINQEQSQIQAETEVAVQPRLDIEEEVIQDEIIEESEIEYKLSESKYQNPYLYEDDNSQDDEIQLGILHDEILNDAINSESIQEISEEDLLPLDGQIEFEIDDEETANELDKQDIAISEDCVKAEEVQEPMSQQALEQSASQEVKANQETDNEIARMDALLKKIEKIELLKKKKIELEEFLKKTKKPAIEQSQDDIESHAKIVENINGIDADSLKTMQQVALLLQKEREKKAPKSVDEQRKMNEALTDLLRAMGKNSK